MGTWSLDHALALRDAGMDVHVVSLTPAIPRLATKLVPSTSTYTACPDSAILSGIQVEYPRWWCCPIKQFWPTIGCAPRLFLTIGWRSVQRKLLAIVDQVQPDVIVANHSLVNGFVASKIKEARDIPFITVDHEVGDFFVCRENAGWLKIMKQVAADSSVGIAVSHAMKQLAEEVIPGANFQTIYNGASFTPCDPALLDRHVDKEEISIFCCGNLYGRKDIPLLIKAFDGVASQFPKAHLRIAGDGPDRAKIQSLIDELDSRSNIKLLGSIEHADVQREMQSADIFALVGWAEPFGVVFLEAMANGLPVVVSEDAGAAEILNDGETAVFIKPRDLDSVHLALEGLMRYPKKRAAVARGGYEFYAKSCRWSHRANEYRSILEKAVSNAATGDPSQ